VKNFATEYLKEKTVILTKDNKEKNRDNFGRLLRYIKINKKDFGELLLKNGYARIYEKGLYAKKSHYLSLEKIAKKEKKGIWSDNCQNKQPAKQINSPIKSCPKDKPIKGNINSKGEKIYHVPGGKYYNETIIDYSKGESCFKNGDEAEKNGFRPAKN
jgi:micrococcal nuclease